MAHVFNTKSNLTVKFSHINVYEKFFIIIFSKLIIHIKNNDCVQNLKKIGLLIFK